MKSRSGKYRLKRVKKKKNQRTIMSAFGVSLAALPIAVNLSPEKAKAEEMLQASDYSQQAFIDSIADAAVSVASANDLYASVMIAQALLESNYGNSQLSAAPHHNLFGIKGSYYGNSVYMPTTEYVNGEWVSITDGFRSYPSYYESFQDNANVLRTAVSANGNYHYYGVWKSNTYSYADATAALTGIYATDPSYNQKLNWLIQAYNLTAYDYSMNYSIEAVTPNETASTAAYSGNTYQVVSGDTLWGIAENHGLSVEQLMALNGLSSDMLAVGQVLVVS